MVEQESMHPEPDHVAILDDEERWKKQAEIAKYDAKNYRHMAEMAGVSVEEFYTLMQIGNLHHIRNELWTLTDLMIRVHTRPAESWESAE